MVTVVTSVFKSFEVEGEDGEIVRVNEGDNIQFSLEETGEIVSGRLTKISGKDEKTKLQIMPTGNNVKEEIYSVVAMGECTLKVLE